MPKSLHIRILEYLHQSNAIEAMVDIKSAFESELDTSQKRRALNTELDFLLREKLVESKGKFDFLAWELVTGLYPLDNKKIEMRLTSQGETYLALKEIVVKHDQLPAPILPMRRVTATNNENDNMTVTNSPLTNALPNYEDDSTVYDGTRLGNEQPKAATARVVKLQSILDMPPGPVNLKSFRANVAAKNENMPVYFNTENTPFADLEIINLNPEPPKKLSTATILKWLVAVIGFILLVMLYNAYQRHVSG
ncbi:hypothetical protein [Mucilaginibacter paludis]|uniref:Uncharacterized protein n=1 Tax=Mucilaginibacter paludis DSM 18603 TaxID=714943 RepID=H1Y5Z8_9SPHI|nr:hypothetical protein [Mucilaginibacter paludis]EHQ30420.1 hypothetical protein Mucpa_6366 [Mucilaginibacter paludis DSM 18603]